MSCTCNVLAVSRFNGTIIEMMMLDASCSYCLELFFWSDGLWLALMLCYLLNLNIGDKHRRSEVLVRTVD